LACSTPKSCPEYSVRKLIFILKLQPTFEMKNHLEKCLNNDANTDLRLKKII
jgi:hypothetical protein